MNQDPDIRGREADALLRNELLLEVLKELDAEYIEAWRNSKKLEAREDAHRYVHVIKRIKTDLQQIALTGEFDRKRKAELERGERPRFFGN